MWMFGIDFTAFRNIWLDATNWEKPVNCQGDACYNHNLTWNDGHLLKPGVFYGINNLNYECWLLDPKTKKLITDECGDKNFVTCQVDCRPGTL